MSDRSDTREAPLGPNIQAAIADPQLVALYAYVAALEAERATLREALREIVATSYRAQLWPTAASIARAALVSEDSRG